MSRKKPIGREVLNSGIDGGFFRGPGPESPGIILPDQRQFRGPERGGLGQKAPPHRKKVCYLTDIGGILLKRFVTCYFLDKFRFNWLGEIS